MWPFKKEDQISMWTILGAINNIFCTSVKIKSPLIWSVLSR